MRYRPIWVTIRRHAPHKAPPQWVQSIWSGLLLHWWEHVCTNFKKSGYLWIITLVSAYVALYAIFEARNERRLNRALFEYNTFMTMVTSGKRGVFIAAMKNFGPVQNIQVPSEPALWPPCDGWFNTIQPNREPLWQWARYFLVHCTPDECGSPNKEDPTNEIRVDLRGAKLGNARLNKVDLHKADLQGASLSGADLFQANLEGATLINANITKTKLPKAWLSGVNMQNVKRYQGIPDGEITLIRFNLPFELQGIDLYQATIQDSNLAGADLSDGDLRGAIFTNVNLFDADMSDSTLRIAEFHNVDLNEAKLDGADLHYVDLREVKNLTQEQIDSACVDKTTKLPRHLLLPSVRPKSCQRWERP